MYPPWCLQVVASFLCLNFRYFHKSMTNNNDIGKFSFVKSICGIHGTVGVRTHGFLRGRLLRTEDYTELVRPSILSTLLTPLVYYLNY